MSCVLEKILWWVEIIEANTCNENISILSNFGASQFMRYLKGKSSFIIFNWDVNLKYKYGNRLFWCKGYYVDTAVRNKKVIEEYIKNQIQEDLVCG